MRFINPKKLWTFARVPNWLMKRKDVSPGAKLCYGRLSQFCDDYGRASPSREDLADELAVTPASIDRYLLELIKCEILVSKRRGQGRSNVYFFPEVPEIASMENQPDMPIVNQESADVITQDNENDLANMATLDLSPLERNDINQESADVITPLILEENKKRRRKDITAPNGDGSKPNSKKKKDSAPNPDVKIFIYWWCNRYQSLLKEQYRVQWGKDGGIAKSLLAQYSLEKVKTVAENLLASTDPFIVGKLGRTIGTLSSQWNKLATQGMIATHEFQGFPEE